MKLCTFRPRTGGPGDGWPGLVEGDEVRRLPGPTLIDHLAAGDPAQPSGPGYPLAEVRLLAPVPRPPSVRDFFAFEAHVATTRGRRGAQVPAEWYQIPVFYFTNPAAVVGPDEEIAYPDGTAELDYELEVAAVIGAGGAIAGFTIMNDWSARDLQRQETRVGLGPAKGKDFATSIGPVLVTVDEFDGSGATMVARVNGEERSRGDLAGLYHPWPALVAQAARNTVLRPGDVLGSGTVGGGCILEHGDNRWLRPGDTVELEVDGLGVLRNQIGPPRPH
ncbi:MAG TPA: fumarylacetoacetate hydrolase family protein [Rugosimonospora sp.]|nr:fumarylacetoacetate hydrolase family protein [Rugosimonospora sp.]